MSFFTAILNGLRRPALPAGSKRMFALTEGAEANIFVLPKGTAQPEPEKWSKPWTGDLLLSQEGTHEALPAVERAELETGEEEQDAIANFVSAARQAADVLAAEEGETLARLVRSQNAILQQVLDGLANLEQRFGELSRAVSLPGTAASASPTPLREPDPAIPKPRPTRASGAKPRRPSRSRSAASRGLRRAGVKQQRPT